MIEYLAGVVVMGIGIKDISKMGKSRADRYWNWICRNGHGYRKAQKE